MLTSPWIYRKKSASCLEDSAIYVNIEIFKHGKKILYGKKDIVGCAPIDANKQLIVAENNKKGKWDGEAPYWITSRGGIRGTKL